MQPRVHQAFYKVKAKCWQVCKNDRSTAEQRSARLACVKDECYKPSQSLDRERARAAGLTYEQMQTPLLMRAVYGSFQPKFVILLRNPVERCAAPFAVAIVLHAHRKQVPKVHMSHVPSSEGMLVQPAYT